MVSPLRNLGITLGKAPNQSLCLVNANTQGLSNVIEASSKVYPSPTGNVEGSNVVRKAIGKVIDALRLQTGKAPGPATVSSPALNVSVSQAEGPTLSFGTSGAANTSIQLPNNLVLEIKNVPITVAMWTTPLDVHGGALNVSWPLQDILFLNNRFARINNIRCKHPSVWAPHSPPSPPTLLRNILFPPTPPVLQYISYNIGNGNIL